MRFFIIPLISVFVLCNSAFASNFNPKEVLEIIETEEEESLHDFYRKLDNISVKEAQEFAETLFELVRSNYGNINFSEIKQVLSRILLNLNCKPNVLKEAENILNKIIDNLEEKELKKSFSTSDYSFENVKYKLEKIKKKEEKKEENVPNGIIIGGAETACGVLLLITPWWRVGTGLVVDGVRRMLNSTEEIAKQDEQKD